MHQCISFWISFSACPKSWPICLSLSNARTYLFASYSWLILLCLSHAIPIFFVSPKPWPIFFSLSQNRIYIFVSCANTYCFVSVPSQDRYFDACPKPEPISICLSQARTYICVPTLSQNIYHCACPKLWAIF